MLRTVDPAVFVPRPRVDSALLRLRRKGPARRRTSRARWSGSAFAHRRKSLARSLELDARRAAWSRPGARWRRSGSPPTPAPRRSRPRSSTRFAEAAGESGGSLSVAELPGAMLAPAKLNLCLYVGPRRDDGLHEIRSLFEPLELADELEADRGRRSDEVSVEGSRARTWPRRRSPRCASTAGTGRRCGSRSRSGSRSPPGLGGGSADAAAVLRLARGRGRGAASDRRRDRRRRPLAAPAARLPGGRGGGGDRAGSRRRASTAWS